LFPHSIEPPVFKGNNYSYLADLIYFNLTIMGSNLFRKKSVDKILKDAAIGAQEGGHLSALKRSLGVFDLTVLGIAAVVGAGIFSTIGKASFDGGPGIVFLFLFASIACGFSAFCYAEFASLVPVSGSAYTYS